ncbi:MAG: DEAD/DEAH box helicase [Clostridiales Family XIII bacterium]|jgi:ATP-dependent RNA helicase DeaD|nr:DEAD/DEAH box helicase [Clostridiales Family XIII bacterium]
MGKKKAGLKLTFKDMNISGDMLRGLKKMNFVAATPVQSKAITPMLDGRDVMVLAPTGSGKTAAFGIPAIENLDMDDWSVQVLVLCPTRELAQQTVVVLHDLTTFKDGVKIQALYGGENIDRQIKALKKRPQIIVATPGRLMDHLNRRTVRLNHLTTVVLDEADRMLDMGFRNDIKAILDVTPENRQTVMFSATMSPEVMQIASKYQKNAQTIRLGGEQKPVDTVTQYYAEVGVREKEATLVSLLGDKRYGLALVFVSRKHLAKNLARMLTDNNFSAAALQGNMSQPQRNRVMEEYRSGALDVLVATDVAARGIDVDNIDVVINYDLPQDSDSYIHRVGRTGRAGKSGDAYTFISQKESYDFAKIVKRTKSSVALVKLEKAEHFIAVKRHGAPSATGAVTGTRTGDAAGKGGRSGHHAPGFPGKSKSGGKTDGDFERILLKDKMFKEQKKGKTSAEPKKHYRRRRKQSS